MNNFTLFGYLDQPFLHFRLPDECFAIFYHMHDMVISKCIEQYLYLVQGVLGVVVAVVPLFHQSATSSVWTPGTGPHYLPNSHLWLQEVASARHGTALCVREYAMLQMQSA